MIYSPNEFADGARKNQRCIDAYKKERIIP
jgi:hypothetical protein